MTPDPTLTRLAGAPEQPLLVVGPSLGTSVTGLWAETATLLGDRFHVVGWDLPGHGLSTPAAGGFTVAELAEGVLQAVSRTLGETPFLYAGDSLGGAVGLALALAAPQRVRGLAALCTGAVIGTPESWAERAALVRGAGTSALVSVSAQRWYAPGFVERRPEVGSSMLHALREIDDESYARCCEALAGHDVRDRLGEIGVPVLAVGGSHDVAAPVERQREIADGVRDGLFVELDAVGHLAPIEAPRTIASLIDGLAARAGRAAGAGAAAVPFSTIEAGMRTRREVLGDAHVERAIAGTTEVNRDFQELITHYAWDAIWNRPGLARRDRSIAVLTALIAGRHFEELEFHLRAALRNGLTREEIVEVLLQSAIYVGVPAANTAFGVAKRVLAEA